MCLTMPPVDRIKVDVYPFDGAWYVEHFQAVDGFAVRLGEVADEILAEIL